ncbi:hypothetical protein ANO11243_079660 [Dothideomycetidae sp. 11243]|nr:hypothetical protein ANO11243_079660 [fungal sp. No.11243]
MAATQQFAMEQLLIQGLRFTCVPTGVCVCFRAVLEDMHRIWLQYIIDLPEDIEKSPAQPRYLFTDLLGLVVCQYPPQGSVGVTIIEILDLIGWHERGRNAVTNALFALLLLPRPVVRRPWPEDGSIPGLGQTARPAPPPPPPSSPPPPPPPSPTPPPPPPPLTPPPSYSSSPEPATLRELVATSEPLPSPSAPYRPQTSRFASLFARLYPMARSWRAWEAFPWNPRPQPVVLVVTIEPVPIWERFRDVPDDWEDEEWFKEKYRQY